MNDKTEKIGQHQYTRVKINQILEDAWLDLDVDVDKLYNPLKTIPHQFNNAPHIWLTYLLSRPEHFFSFVKLFFNIELAPFQCVILEELWKRKFPMLIAARGASKSFLLAIHSLLRAILLPERKIIITGSVFRQAKIIFDYVENIWYNSPILRDIAEGDSTSITHGTDMWKLTIGDSRISALPTGNGEKIRGQRAHDIIVDEMSVVPIDVLENVIVGFASVSANPIENIKQRAIKKKRKQLGFIDVKQENEFKKSNQIVISGTAFYSFNHFCDYWKRWKTIIESKGDETKLMEVFNKADIPDDFDWRDYSIIRLPYTLLPDGYIDEGQIARSKATLHTGLFNMEFGSIFTDDSAGFFKRSLIESCVAHERKGIQHNGELVTFPPLLKGYNKKYVMGVDPASEVDNFSIVIEEINQGYLSIVYCWTTNSRSHKLAIKKGYTDELNFYAFCARKIRDLMIQFRIEEIAIDSQGGGKALYEALHEKDKIKAGEYLLWEVVDDDKPKDSDYHTGLHIIRMINFADATWNNNAHHNLRKDFGTKSTLFPYFDALSIGLANLKDEFEGRDEGIVYDRMEDIVLEIEELKNELSTIVHTQTAAGRDRFDVPEVRLPGGKKGRQKKDRVSALVMCNSVARELMQRPIQEPYKSDGGFAENVKIVENAVLYPGNAWYNEAAVEAYSMYN